MITDSTATLAGDPRTMARALRMNADELESIVAELHVLVASGAVSLELAGRAGMLRHRLANAAELLDRCAELEDIEQRDRRHADAVHRASQRSAATRRGRFGA